MLVKNDRIIGEEKMLISELDGYEEIHEESQVSTHSICLVI